MSAEPSKEIQPGISAELPKVQSHFPTTRWTLVQRLRQGGEGQQAALDELCALYWYPIYAFLRRRGHAHHDAEDITQGFFIKLLNDASFEASDANRGLLRTFLLSALQRHIADRNRHDLAQKRGGGMAIIAFESMGAEERYGNEPKDHRDPEHLFAQAWARELLETVRRQLESEFSAGGRSETFQILLPFLIGEDPPSYRDVAARLKASETAVRVLVFRMRTRFRECLRETVATTVQDPAETESEIQWIVSILTGP
jgi:RNA polymerase sigma-70 factor (ECF subfamily)